LTTTLGEVGEIETDTPTIVAVAVAALLKSDTEVAVIVTVALAGTAAGAVYVAGAPLAVDAVIVPHPGEHAVPPWLRAQVTPLFPASFPTVAVKVVVPFTATLALDGATATVMAGTVIVPEAFLVLSAAEVAVIVTVRLLAGGPGAV
jgi:hypothetical protein